MIAEYFQTTVQAILQLNPGLNPNNLRIGQVILIPIASPCPTPDKPEPKCISMAELSLSNQMRQLWSQHVYWTRFFVLSDVFNLPDLEFVTNRLLRNPKDFEAALKPFYGEDNAAQFNVLLTEHLTIAAELVNAAKAGDNAAAADAERRWYANADQIAAFLGSINPCWSVREWRRMMREHLDLLKVEVTNILTQDFTGGVRIFDVVERQALEMADMMTIGIVKQFPERFVSHHQ